MADIEKLIVELDAKIDGYVAGMKKAGKESDTFGDKTIKMGKSIFSLGAKAGAAAIAVGTALSTMIVMSGKAQRELEQQAEFAKLTTDEFEALSHATRQYGVDAEKMADISKDLADRLGEFATVGTGAFQDFADVMRMSREEAVGLAKDWQDLSSDEVLGEMTRMMEENGSTANQMTFVYESMAGDLSKLAPLFANNSSELNKLTGEYNQLNGSLSISKEQAVALAESAKKFDEMSASVSKAGRSISAQLAPAFNAFIDTVIQNIPAATKALGDFLNMFVPTDLLSGIDQVQARLFELMDQREKDLAFLEETKRKVETASPLNPFAPDEVSLAIIRDRIAEVNDEIAVAEAKLEQLQGVSDADTPTEEPTTITTDRNTDDAVYGERLEARLKMFEDSQKTELELIDEQYNRSKEYIDASIVDEGKKAAMFATLLEEKQTLTTEYYDYLFELGGTELDWLTGIYIEEVELHKQMLAEKIINQEEYDRRIRDSANKLEFSKLKAAEETGKKKFKALVGLDTATGKQIMAGMDELSKKSETAAKVQFRVKQVQRLGEAVMGTASGIAEAMPNFPLAAATAVLGAAQIATIASQSFNGGGGAPSVGGSGDFTPVETAADVEEPEFTDVSTTITDVTGGSVTTQRLIISLEDGSDLIEGIAKKQDEARADGRI